MEEAQKPKEGGNVYDKIIKENIEDIFLPLTEKYLGFKIVSSEIVKAKLQSTIEREADFLRIVKTDMGEEFILHIEFQSGNEADMIYRIKEYNAMIQRKHRQDQRKKDAGKPKHKRGQKHELGIRHYIIYLGKGKMRMQTELEEKHVFRHFEVLSLNELDFTQMLQSQIPAEIVLAILSDFKGADPEKIIRLIVEKLKKYSENDTALEKFIEQLNVLSNLRNLEKKTIKTIKNMPITFNIEDSYTYQLGKKKGRVEGKKEGKKEGKDEAIAIMMLLQSGTEPAQIAEDLEVSIELVREIQQKLV